MLTSQQASCKKVCDEKSEQKTHFEKEIYLIIDAIEVNFNIKAELFYHSGRVRMPRLGLFLLFHEASHWWGLFSLRSGLVESVAVSRF